MWRVWLPIPAGAQRTTDVEEVVAAFVDGIAGHPRHRELFIITANGAVPLGAHDGGEAISETGRLGAQLFDHERRRLAVVVPLLCDGVASHGRDWRVLCSERLADAPVVQRHHVADVAGVLER